MNKFEIIFYAINGTGLGHISRLLNVARELDNISIALNIKADIKFVTTSEGSQVASQFPVYKLPSMQIQRDFVTDKQKLLADNQFFVSNLFGTFRPDIAVLDTKPEGAYGEFLLFEKYCKKKVFVNRRTSQEAYEREGRNELINKYDLVLIPDSEHNTEFYPNITTAKKFTDTIHGFRPECCIERSKVRALFKVKDNEKLIYLSSGGGGDKNVQSEINSVLDVLSDRDDIKILVGYGALYKGEIRYGKNILPYTGTEVRQYFKGVDAAISAAGYNTYQELLAAKIPTMFFYQKKGMDEQHVRVLEGAKKGWNYILHNIYDKGMLLDGLDKLLSQGETLHCNLTKRTLTVGSVNAALEILCQLINKENSVNDYMDLHFVAFCLMCWKQSIHDEFSGVFCEHMYWILKIQPLIMGSCKWQETIEVCYLSYKNKNNEPISESVLDCFRNSQRIIKLHEKFQKISKDRFSLRIVKFLKKGSIEQLNPITFKGMTN